MTMAVPIFEANNWVYHCVNVCPHVHAQCATWIKYRILTYCSCNFIADWTVILGKISIVGLALATSQLPTTDISERSYQPGSDFVFPKLTFGKKSVIQGSFQHSWLSKWPFLHYNDAEDKFSATLA